MVAPEPKVTACVTSFGTAQGADLGGLRHDFMSRVTTRRRRATSRVDWVLALRRALLAGTHSSVVSFDERDGDVVQYAGYVEDGVHVDFEYDAAVLGDEVDPAEGQSERVGCVDG